MARSKLKPKSVRKRQTEPSSIDGLSNHQIVTIAVYLCGGESRPVDTEDAAVKANELAPGRYSWRKYPEQINIENVRTFLKDATRLGLISGRGSEGWMLRAAGKRFAARHVAKLGTATAVRHRLSPEEKRWIARERARLLESPVTRTAMAGRASQITRREAEQFFRLDDYVVGTARDRKISRLINLLGDDKDLGHVISVVAQRLLEEDSQ